MTFKSEKRVIDAEALNNAWQERGGRDIWLPYAQMKNAMTPLMVHATEGSLLHLEDGRQLIDGIASWWTACHGYNHPHILSAMEQQLQRMPHVMFGGLNHLPALKLAQRLTALAPGDLGHVFFSDSGSVAVEIALKMAVQYWRNKGTARKRFVSFRHGYHGDTMACMSLADPDQWHAAFDGYGPKQWIADLPTNEKKERALEELLGAEHNNIAALIVEPLVQGAGGMKFHARETLQRIEVLCRRYDVLLIADEIFTGFGRTGSLFACDEAKIVPDILCLGKALTGGAISLAATLARDEIFDAFWSDQPNHALMHGPTYMANPLACAAANASLDLFESEPRLAAVARIEAQLREGLEPCRRLQNVRDVRVKGAIGVVELEQLPNHKALKQAFIEQGLWVRPFGNIIYLTPAFTIEALQCQRLTDGINEVIAKNVNHS